MNPLEQLKAVLCDPEDKCCITGSDEDRAIVDRALQALAQPAPVQGPLTDDHIERIYHRYGGDMINCARAIERASQRQWVGLTDEEIEREWQFQHDEEGNPPDHHDFSYAIEAKLKEKNT